MVTKKKNDEVTVFSGAPWETASVIGLLNAAYINVSVIDEGSKEIKLSVPSEHYTAAMRVIDNRKILKTGDSVKP